MSRSPPVFSLAFTFRVVGGGLSKGLLGFELPFGVFLFPSADPDIRSSNSGWMCSLRLNSEGLSFGPVNSS